MKKQAENVNHFWFLFRQKIIFLFFLTLAKLVRHILNTSVFDLFINISYVYIEALSQNLKSNSLSLLVNRFSVLESQAQGRWLLSALLIWENWKSVWCFPALLRKIQAQISVVCPESILSTVLFFFFIEKNIWAHEQQ